MKKLFFTLSLALLSVSAFGQAYDSRVDVARLATDEARVYRDERGDWDRRARIVDDLARLDREVRQVCNLIGDSRRVSRNIRDRFHRVLTAKDYLNAQFRRGNMHGGEVHRRAENIRADLDLIRRDLRNRR